MDWNQAVEQLALDDSRENLYRVAEELCDELTLNEKLFMMSGNNAETVAATIKGLIKAHRLYNYTPWKAGGVKRLGIPEVSFTDGPRGVVMGNSTCFPVSTMRAASFDLVLEAEVMQAMAEEAIAQGANYFAGICINLLRNPRWGRAQESYGEDPFVLGEFGATDTRVMQENGVMACVKHYACNSLENLRFEIDVHADERTMYEVYLPHFKKCVDAGAASIMGAYNKLDGDQCCESHWLLTDVLRDEWQFDGFTLSDFLWGVHDGLKAVKAGLDIEMPFTSKYGGKLKAALRKGELTEDVIDARVQSILRGLLHTLPHQKAYEKEVVQSLDHLALAQVAAEEGTVLLENDGILPLKSGMKIAVIGAYADAANLGDHGSSDVHSDVAITPYQGIAARFGAENVVCNDGKDTEKATALAKEADVVVVIAGLDFSDEGEYILNKKSKQMEFKGQGGERKTMVLSDADVSLIRKIAAANPNVVVSMSGGSALIINEWVDSARAVLMSFYAGSMGGHALAHILAGDVNPSGKLPYTVAHNENDYPAILTDDDEGRDITYGYYHGYTLFDKNRKPVDYPFGYGLSYTEFEVSDARARISDDALWVGAKVKNVGSVAGTDVLQVYVGSNDAGKERPHKLLKGFQRVPLEVGECRDVWISIPKDELRFFDETTHGWVFDNAYTVYIGDDSRKAENLKITPISII